MVKTDNERYADARQVSSFPSGDGHEFTVWRNAGESHYWIQIDDDEPVKLEPYMVSNIVELAADDGALDFTLERLGYTKADDEDEEEP